MLSFLSRSIWIGWDSPIDFLTPLSVLIVITCKLGNYQDASNQFTIEQLMATAKKSFSSTCIEGLSASYEMIEIACIRAKKGRGGGEIGKGGMEGVRASMLSVRCESYLKTDADRNLVSIQQPRTLRMKAFIIVVYT